MLGLGRAKLLSVQLWQAELPWRLATPRLVLVLVLLASVMPPLKVLLPLLMAAEVSLLPLLVAVEVSLMLVAAEVSSLPLLVVSQVGVRVQPY